MRRFLALTLFAILLSACANDGLQQVSSSGRGPDEFIVDPKAELSMPGNFTELPPPTPGRGNRVDVDPLGTMTAELGGRAGDPNAPIPGADAALVTAASRFGVPENIRQAVAQEDADFRRGQSRFTGFQLFPENLYNRVYRSQTLNARATAEAWLRAGAGTPSFSPRQ
jgi:hypothetical protein